MARYGQVFKDRAVARLLPPESAPEIGVSADTLERWRSEELAKPARERGWTAAARLEAVILTAAMDESARSAWCRERGVYPQQLQQWRDSATQALAEPAEKRVSPQLRANGAALPYTTYDRLSEVDQGAIVDNKRLGHVLQLAQYVQEKRDNTRSLSVPGTEGAPRKRGRPPGKKSQRSLDQNDMLESLKRLQQQPWPLNGTES